MLECERLPFYSTPSALDQKLSSGYCRVDSVKHEAGWHDHGRLDESLLEA